MTASTLDTDYVAFARASLATRIEAAAESIGSVLEAVQEIALQFNDSEELRTLKELQKSDATPSKILNLLRDVLKHLDSKDALAQLIAPLFSTLQFEDRSRQKLETIGNILQVWSETRHDDSLDDEALANLLKVQVISMEQQEILAKYFPDYIVAEEKDDEDDISFF